MSRFASFLLEIRPRCLETVELRVDFFLAGFDLLDRLRLGFLLRLFERRELRGERRADLIDPCLRQSAAALPRITKRSAARSLHRAAAVRRPRIDRQDLALRSDRRDAAEAECAMRAVAAELRRGAAEAELLRRAVRAECNARALSAGPAMNRTAPAPTCPAAAAMVTKRIRT